MTAEVILALAALITAAGGFLKIWKDVSAVKSEISEVKVMVNGNHHAMVNKLDVITEQRDDARAEIRHRDEAE